MSTSRTSVQRSGSPFGNVLVTSAGRKIPLLRSLANAVQRARPGAKVIAGDVDPAALSRYIADDFWQMKRNDESEMDWLLEQCGQRDIRAIVPTRDGELLFWAQRRDALSAAGVDVLVANPQAVERCIDKLEFSAFGRQHALPVIPAAERIDALHADRYVVKERRGAGSRSIGIGLDRSAALQHAQQLAEPIFQPLIAGREISVDGWLDRQGRVKGAVLRNRERVENGESVVTATFRDTRLEREVIAVLQALQLRGPVVLQAIVDAQGAPHIIEVNARFGGASTAGIAAGLDPWYWSLLELQGSGLDSVAFERVPGEIRQVRVSADVICHDPDL